MAHNNGVEFLHHTLASGEEADGKTGGGILRLCSLHGSRVLGMLNDYKIENWIYFNGVHFCGLNGVSGHIFLIGIDLVGFDRESA